MGETLSIGSRRELFVDRYLVGSMTGTTFKLHTPVAAPVPQGPIGGAYMTVFQDVDRYRAYYRAYDPAFAGNRNVDGNEGEVTCYAESRDGAEWTRPELNICPNERVRPNNIILQSPPYCHNFAPMKDTNPNAAPETRYKALAGVHTRDAAAPLGGLHAFRSPDGVRWVKVQDAPVIDSVDYAFDSENVSFWSPAESCYVCYFRTWKTSEGKFRTISRCTSPDYLHWSEPVCMNPNVAGEHLYTSQAHPYFRAPHIIVCLPTRFRPDRGDSTDILFMATRAGSTQFERLFTEAFIRPGFDPKRWGNRANYAACGIVPTGPTEMSLYHASGMRYVLRTDGFISVHAGFDSGEFVTKPFTFTGRELVLNYSTSAAGSVQVEIQQPDGTPVPGFALSDCTVLIGDRIERQVGWQGAPDLGRLAGQPIRVRFVMREADLFAIQFRQG